MPTKVNNGDEPVELEGVEVIHETDKAIKFTYEGETKWAPKSAVHDDSEVHQKDDTGTLIVKRWYAEKEGLVEE
jgi:hypothetical protein